MERKPNLESHILSFGHYIITEFAGHKALAKAPDSSEHPFLPQLHSPGLSPLEPPTETYLAKVMSVLPTATPSRPCSAFSFDLSTHFSY